METLMGKVGIALIGPSGTGKTTIGKILATRLGMHFHDMDDDGLEGNWGTGGVARILAEKGDDGFLSAEGAFVVDSYGRGDERKKYSFDNMIFATAGSLVLEEEAIEYTRERLVTIYLDLPDAEISRRARERGVSRIVGMNGENPRFKSVEEVLVYRRGFYEKYADLTYPLEGGNTPEEDAEFVLSFIEKYTKNLSKIPSLLHDSRSSDRASLRRSIITSQPPSGGLWCPDSFPEVSLTSIETMKDQSYQSLAKMVLGKWNFGISEDELGNIIDSAYGSQWHRDEITPVRHITENLYSLHLGYGPTFAFKNIALEFLPRLLSVLTKGKIIHVLGASSGDTVNAAHSGVRGTNIYSVFMLPATGPSVVQRLQAVSGIRNNPNAFTLLADASFDPLQDIVKKINSPEYREFKEQYNITSFNSINIARILAQTVYYFRAYSELLRMRKISLGERISFSVPSGNFGDALAGYYAMRMGLPIEKINIATNENDMLHTFFQTGRYAPPKKDGRDYVAVTNAPSMDIAKSSNFERMLYDMVDGDDAVIKKWYTELSERGYFEVDESTLEKIQRVFTSSSSSDTERLDAIREFSDAYEHGIDPHTAAAVVPWIRTCDDDKSSNNLGFLSKNTPLVFLETSHIAQFASELEAVGIDIPSMHEFDDILDQMRQSSGVEGENYAYTGSDFDTIFPDIEEVFSSILMKKR